MASRVGCYNRFVSARTEGVVRGGRPVEHDADRGASAGLAKVPPTRAAHGAASDTGADRRRLVAGMLGGCPLFSSLTRDQLLSIAPSFTEGSLGQGEILFREGDPPTSLWIVLNGLVKLIKHSEDGRDIILHIAMPGDLLGGVSAFGRRPHPFTAQAMQTVAFLRVPGQDYAGIMETHPTVARGTVDDLVERLTEAHETMKSLAVERVERRVARQLWRLLERTGQPVPGGMAIGVPLSRQDVADMAGTTVESAIRVLSRWRRAGMMSDHRGVLVAARPDALRALATGESTL